MKKELDKELIEVINLFLFILLIVCVIRIGEAIHTIDSVHNYMKLAEEVNKGNFMNERGDRLNFPNIDNMLDIGSDYQGYSLSNWYIQGMNKLRRYTLLSIILSLMIGYLQNNSRKWKKK